MACTSQTQNELLEAILEQDTASFDRLQQIIQTIQSSAGTGGDYAFFFNKAVSATVAIAAPFPFDTDGPKTSGFLHTASAVVATSAPITIVNAGTYAVNYSITVAEAHQFALYINGAVVTSTIYGQATGTSATSAFAIITVAAGAVLTLRNHLSVAALTLVTPSGGTAGNNTNSLMIRRLA